MITIRLHIPARPAAGGEEEGKRKVVNRQATPHLDTDHAVVVAMAHGQKNWAGDIVSIPSLRSCSTDATVRTIA